MIVKAREIKAGDWIGGGPGTWSGSVHVVSIGKHPTDPSLASVTYIASTNGTLETCQFDVDAQVKIWRPRAKN